MNKPRRLQPGMDAPFFSSIDQNGKTFDSKSLIGSRYLIYFYPRDLTPGCTTEACELRDAYQEFSNQNTLVLGVSTDSQKSHRKFSDKYNLPFPLLVDQNHSIAEAFCVWGEKKFMGRTFEGVHRMSFLVGKDGKIKKTFEKVKPADHARQVLQEL